MPSFDDPRGKDPCGVDARHADERAPYEPPRLAKKRSVARVTLTSGSGGGGLSSSGAMGVTCVTCH
jgi:hypothetical protein